MKKLMLLGLVIMVITSCGKSQWQQGDAVNNGHDFLCSAGICDDSLNVADDVNYNDDGANLPHHILDISTCQAIGLDKMMQVDTVTSIVRVWGMRDYPDKGITLLLGQTSYSDMRTCWLATYGKDGMLDFMRLGECGGMNLSYWDDVDEHTRNVGVDSMRMVMPQKNDQPIHLSRWVSYKIMSNEEVTDSTLWFIHHELPISIDREGHFSVGKIGTVYSSDTTLLNNYWRCKRQLEVFSWTPMSDDTIYDRLNKFLVDSRGSITDPIQLQGDFFTLVSGRFYCDTERFMKWCCEHPDSQLTKGLVSTFKDISPEYTLSVLKKIKDPILLKSSRRLLGV